MSTRPPCACNTSTCVSKWCKWCTWNFIRIDYFSGPCLCFSFTQKLHDWEEYSSFYLFFRVFKIGKCNELYFFSCRVIQCVTRFLLLVGLSAAKNQQWFRSFIRLMGIFSFPLSGDKHTNGAKPTSNRKKGQMEGQQKTEPTQPSITKSSCV